MIQQYVSLMAYEGMGFRLRVGEQVLYKGGNPAPFYGPKYKAKVISINPLKLSAGPFIINEVCSQDVEVCVEVQYKQLPIEK